MKTSFLILISLVFCSDLLSQEFSWQLRLNNFIDNMEFISSEVKKPQTLAGVNVEPRIGFTWDTIHQLHIGVNMIHEYGSPDVIDQISPLAYYEFNRKHLTFLMGAMPRDRITGSYPRILFQDSVKFYRPYINGVFFEYRNRSNYINTWLDWTGRQSETVNEAFFIGLSGRYNRGMFYLQNYGYLFHYAEKLSPETRVPLHENVFSLTSLGADFTGKTFFTRLEINAGWLFSLERSRGETDWISLNGFYSEARVEYKWFGLLNSFYTGDGLMYFYDTHGNDLYWGDPVYRVNTHDRTEFYVKFLQNRTVDIELGWSFHFLEGNVYQEQLLTVNININSPGK